MARPGSACCKYTNAQVHCCPNKNSILDKSGPGYILWQRSLREWSLYLGLGQGVVDEWSIQFYTSTPLLRYSHDLRAHVAPLLWAPKKIFLWAWTFHFFSFLMSIGTISMASPTMPRSATLNMGASGSLLIAITVFAELMPTRCWMAPLIPTAI
jgi:hypothetical protein